MVESQSRIATLYLGQETSGFETLDLLVRFELYKGLLVGVALLNIFDKTYYEHLNFSYSNSDIFSGIIYESGKIFTTYIKYKLDF